MTVLLQTRVKTKVAAGFQKAARRRGLSPYAFLQQIVTDAASQAEAVSSSASLELSRAGFALPELPGRTERERIRVAIARRHVSR
ncbi:MAG TPA: hypothetical protein VF430_00180 [Verrucomicrobiae bacterium]|jgi:hypothetical protein